MSFLLRKRRRRTDGGAAIRYIGDSKNTVDTNINTDTKMVRDNQRKNNSNRNSNSISNKNKSSSSSSSGHTEFTSSRVLILLGCLICLAFGLNVYLSILHDPTKTKNSNVEPIVDALVLKNNNNNNITSIKKLEVDDDLIQAITTITAVKTKTKVKAKNEASSTNSTNGNANATASATATANFGRR